jgi:hypothetical protein
VTVLPLEVLRLVVGGLLLVFGLQWLCKAVLRAGGQLALHDEDAIYSRKLRAAQLDGDSRRPPGDNPPVELGDKRAARHGDLATRSLGGPQCTIYSGVLTTPIRCPSGSWNRPISMSSMTFSGPIVRDPPRLSAWASAASTSGTPT